MNTSEWHVGVLIPARNEENLLPRCLDSMHRAIDFLRGSATVDIVVAADRCSDRTLRIAERMLWGRGAAIEIDAGAAGVARCRAAKAALRRSRKDPKRCWLANTDADCVVPDRWLADQLNLAIAGVEAIAGTVSVDNFNEHCSEVPSRFRASYRIDSDGSHPHVHGANLGVRADVYLDAGGWASLETGEDHDLWRRLRRSDRRILSTSHIEVVTSGRRQGRAPAGFADALAAHNGVAA